MSHSFIQNRLLLYNSKFHSIKDEQLDSLILLMLTMLLSLCLISSKQTGPPINAFAAILGLKLSMCYMLTMVQHKSMVAMKREMEIVGS